MQSHKNNIIIASAGGRKTTFIVEDALKQKDKKVLITTYTLENLNQINSYIVERNGCMPKNITVLSWYTFLLRHGVRPYQNYLLKKNRVQSIDFKSTPNRYTKKSEQSYFLNQANNIYRDKVSNFICLCDKTTKGLTIKRLEKIFDNIYIDEMQDLSGWDQTWVELLLNSSIVVTMVGDPRQATYSTNYSQKNKSKKGRNMVVWLKELMKNNICHIVERNQCFRCNQIICNFADELYPKLTKTTSKNIKRTGYDGVFTITQDKVVDYIKKYYPAILRWNKNSATMGFPAINIGVTKGKTYDRVLIFPTKPMKKYLKTKDINQAGDISKLYVAVTRARYSVAFVVGNKI